MKLVLGILVVLMCAETAFSQNYNWIIPNKTYLKFYISNDGIYRINKSDFTQAGINTSSIDPRTVKVYYKGSQVPIYFEGEDDGSFDDNDFFDFYATRNYGGQTNTYYDSLGTNAVAYTTNEYYNLYSDTSVYWAGWDGTNGIRLTLSSFMTQVQFNQNFSFEDVHLEKDSVYSLGETINPNADFRYFNTEKVKGEGWYWRNLISPSVGGVYDLFTSFLSPDLSTNPQTCSLKLFAYPNSQDLSTSNEHRITVYINNTAVSTLQRNHYNWFDTTVSFSSSVLSQTGPNQVHVQYQPAFQNQGLVPSLYFDMLDLTYPRIMKFTDQHSKFYLSGSDTASVVFSVTGFNVNQPIHIYDVKNNFRITTFSNNADTLFFTGKKNGNFEVYNQNITRKPFKITPKQVPDLVSSTNQADYVLIYNRIFESPAEQLRAYRQQHDNFHAVKTAVDDIIDIFNYGLDDPVAIRRFTDYVLRNWSPGPLKYVCLMGRGSLDPKHNILTNNYYQNFVPVYGNPPSDGYFANNNFGGFTYYKKFAIGRIPAYTVGEAQNMVNKIIDYESQPAENWWKIFTLITGGKNRNEQLYNQTASDTIANRYVLPPPVFSDAHKIYRNDSSGYITFNYKDSIIHEIDRGSIIVNFIGHAASQDWELGLEDPGVLTNSDKLPVVLSFTCFTGKNAEPDKRGFGEEFINNPNGGCISFVGTTGWSFNTSGNVINQEMLKNFATDSVRRIGDMLKYGSQYLAPDSLSFYSRNMVNCYDMLGDPATKILLPASPEFSITEADYRISDPYPLIGENVSLTIYPKNFGTYAPDCLTRFELRRNGIPVRTIDTLFIGFGHYDTAAYLFRIDTLGNYDIRISVDADNHYPEKDEGNNVLIIPLPLRNISYTPLKPIYNSIIHEDSVEFVGLNPQVDPARNNIRVILQVDTSKTFSHPLYSVSQSNISGVVTHLRYHIPFADSSRVYFWRTNSIVNNDSAGWSAIMRFVYNTNAENKRGARFGKTMLNDSNVTVYAKLPGQFETSDMSNLIYNGSGYELRNFQGAIQVKSHGNSGQQASYFQLPDYTLFIDQGLHAGLNIVKASRLTGRLLEYHNFTMTSTTSSDSVLAFLNTYDTSNYLLSLIASSIGPYPLNTAAKNKYRQFGSTMVDSVLNFSDFSTWAFIGYLGSGPVTGAEDFHRPSPSCADNYCPSIANYSAVFVSTSGFINFPLGPAHRWKNFSWAEVLQPNSNIKFNVIGYNRSSQPVTLLSNVTANTFVNLDTLNSFGFPNLKLVANVSIDTILGFRSPVFNSLTFRYTPPCELIPDDFSFTRSDSIVNEGTSVTFGVKLYNAGFVPANALVLKWTSQSTGGFSILRTDTVYTPLAVDSMKLSSVTFNTQGLRDPDKLIDTLTIGFEAEPLGTQNDYFGFNNFAFSKLMVKGDTTRPHIDVTFDSKHIINGDPIASEPEILFKFYDYSQNAYSISDTSRIFIKQWKTDSTALPSRVYYGLNGQTNPHITFNPVNNGNLKVVVTYKPSLTAGNYNFDFIGENTNGKRDTSSYNANVTNQFNVDFLYNYPNPMRNETYFTFILYSPGTPQSCRIKIYTVAGRLIKEINAAAKVGFNQIYWDGHDADGENIANGIYLYKLIIEDNGKTASQIQKLAVLK